MMTRDFDPITEKSLHPEQFGTGMYCIALINKLERRKRFKQIWQIIDIFSEQDRLKQHIYNVNLKNGEL